MDFWSSAASAAWPAGATWPTFRGRSACSWATLGSLVLFYTLGMPLVMDRFVGAPLLARAALAVSMIAPLGFSLGAFMPLGLATVGALSRHTREYVAWAWGVNGFFSVIMAILATILAMELGFRGVLLIALVFYGAAAGALLVLARRAEQNHE